MRGAQMLHLGDRKAGRGCKNHNFHVKENFRKLGFEQFSDIRGSFSRNTLISNVAEALTNDFFADWYNTINSESGRNGNGRNKLRTYRLFKSEYKIENYCKFLLPGSHRAAFAKFRCGVAPIRIETRRFENLDIGHFCNVVEDESHVILECSLYNNLRCVLFSKAASVLPNFYDLNHTEKMSFLFSNTDMIRLCAKTCFKMLQTRNTAFNK